MNAAVTLPQTGQRPKNGKKKVKKSRLRYYIGVPAVLLTALIIFGMMPIKGTIRYGICKIFIEQRTTYPEQMRVVSLLERPSDVKIEYTFINEFGGTQLNTITCVYGADQNAMPALTDVIINRRKVDRALINKFNLGIPALLAYPPNLNAPLPATEDLKSLWRS